MYKVKSDTPDFLHSPSQPHSHSPEGTTVSSLLCILQGLLLCVHKHIYMVVFSVLKKHGIMHNVLPTLTLSVTKGLCSFTQGNGYHS